MNGWMGVMSMMLKCVAIFKTVEYFHIHGSFTFAIYTYIYPLNNTRI